MVTLLRCERTMPSGARVLPGETAGRHRQKWLFAEEFAREKAAREEVLNGLDAFGFNQLGPRGPCWRARNDAT